MVENDEVFLNEVIAHSREGLRRCLQNGTFNRVEYEWAVAALNKWAEGQYEVLRRTVN